MEAGADAISAINTIKSVTMTAEAEVAGQRTISGYSGRAVRPIALRHVLELAQSLPQTELSIIDDLTLGLQRYMAKRSIMQLQQLVGEQLPKFLNPDHLDRETIVFPKIDRDQCIGCHLCRLVCPTGAIGITKRIKKK